MHPTVKTAIRGIAVGGMLSCVAVLGLGAALPKHPPVPKPKPVPPAGTPVETRSASGQKIPLPEKRPAPGDANKPAAAPPAATDHEQAATPKGPEGPPEPEPKKPEPAPVPGIHEDGAALAACYGRLDALGVVYSKEKTVNGPGRCGIEDPISVTSILPGISLKPANEMRCKTALALAQWTKNVVEPSAEQLGPHVKLTGLAHGSAYVCKHRDSIATRKISQHAFGNAIDVVTFSFDGHPPLSIASRVRTGKIEQGFQTAVIGGACLYFTTVLGPRADSFHQDNLHLDVDERSHGFRLCQ